MRAIESWGKYPKTRQTVVPFPWSCDPLPEREQGKTLLPYGLGRSYGDVCLNDGGTLLCTQGMNRILGFDSQSGVIRCEAGCSLDTILKFAVPRGWFLPTTPGTKYVTVGGAIANDIHGKNHHRAGTFGTHVRRFELLRSDGSRRICSPEENSEWFRATIGGLGLTGLITWVEFGLRAIRSSWIDVESVKFGNLDEFFELSKSSDHGFEHTVAWVDCVAKGASLGRGIFMRGNHSEQGGLEVHREPKLSVPIDFPSFTLNRYTVQAFNTLYYARLRKPVTRQLQHYDPFFYPLDSVNHWNRIYGRKGFFQYQFVVPFEADRSVLREVFEVIATSGQGSFLAVLKTFGEVASPGLLSFPSPGVTLALDFPNGGARTHQLFERLDQILLPAGGRFYPAKDARMSPDSFAQSYPRWSEFQPMIDPAFSSSFYRRITKEPSL